MIHDADREDREVAFSLSPRGRRDTTCLASPCGTDTFGTYRRAKASRVEPPIVDLIKEADAGNATAARALFAALYDELHRLAERQLRRTGSDLSLGPTTLLHEAYLDMAGRQGVHFPDRARFMGYAARAMRGLIIDYARRSRTKKRGGGAFEITLTADESAARDCAFLLGDEPVELDQLSDALDEMAEVEPPLAQLVDLHFFCGFSLVEIATLRGVSERTVQRDWRKARLFLSRALRVGGA
jgi:RNA polymerase sigma factor (TIGR02999 family)